jgi:DMSO/TMAO reductase YedYZ molybdopterin-dependent catalytic subunit
MNTSRVLVIVLVLAAAVLVAAFVIRMPSGSAVSLQPSALAPVEVRSYEGKDLSSINDFRENSIAGPQHVDIGNYRLTVTGLTNRTLVYTYDEALGKFPHFTKAVTLYCVEGWDVSILWEGVRVSDLLDDAGIDPRANTVIFTAHDGYTTSFPLSYFRQHEILMAFRMNGVTLPPERGYPFQLVAEDKWGYKWIKWIEKIELSDDPTYRGYWEKRGYSNDGALNGSISEK